MGEHFQMTIAEIGPGSWENIIGCGFSNFDQPTSVNRIAVFDPTPPESTYQNDHRMLTSLSDRLGLKILNQNVFPDHIDSPLPPCILIAAGDLLNDPVVNITPDSLAFFAQLIHDSLLTGGLLLMADTWPIPENYSNLSQVMPGNMTLLLDEAHHPCLANTEKVNLVINALKTSGVVLDLPLEQGLINNSTRSWVIYQKQD